MSHDAAAERFAALDFDPRLDLYACFLRARDIVPDKPALSGDGRRYNYAEMADAADRIAWHLLANAARPGDTIALITDRTPEAILAMAGILLAGCTYVPLDPATRRPGDPATRRPGDPATRRPGDPARPCRAS